MVISRRYPVIPTGAIIRIPHNQVFIYSAVTNSAQLKGAIDFSMVDILAALSSSALSGLFFVEIV